MIRRQATLRMQNQPIKAHQTPPKPIKTHQNPTKPHQSPSNPIKAHQCTVELQISS